MTDDLHRTLENFLVVHPECLKGKDVLGDCDFLSQQLLSWLPGATLVRVRGYRGDPKRGHWKSLHPSQCHHTLVRLGDRYIDVTARQFDKDASVPRYMSRADLEREWSVIEDSPTS